MSLPAPNAAEIRQPSSDGIAKASNDNFAAARTGASGGDSGVCVWWVGMRLRPRNVQGTVGAQPQEAPSISHPAASRVKKKKLQPHVPGARQSCTAPQRSFLRLRRYGTTTTTSAAGPRNCRVACETTPSTGDRAADREAEQGAPGAIDRRAYSPNSRLASSASGGSSSSPVSFLISSLFLSRKV